MSNGQRISLVAAITIFLTLIVWIFAAGGAWTKAQRACSTADEAHMKSVANEREIAVIQTRMDSNHAEQVRRLSRIETVLDRVAEKVK